MSIVAMMQHFNSIGISLLSKFLVHIENYSIMQIVQRLMLPHIPFTANTEIENLTFEEKELHQCNWSFYSDHCRLLIETMLISDPPPHPDVALHLSDLLITVLQLSPPETLIIKLLCEETCIQRLMDHACSLGGDVSEVGDYFSPEASLSLACISVLESLISRLFENSIPFQKISESGVEIPQSMSEIDPSEMERISTAKERLDRICRLVAPYLKLVDANLRNFLDSNPCRPLRNQGRTSSQRIGHRGLQLVKLVESVMRIGNPAVDEQACSSGLVHTCLRLFCTFETNSLLHFSIHRMIISIIDSEASRRDLATHLVVKCDLLGIIMKTLSQYQLDNNNSYRDSSKDNSLLNSSRDGEKEISNSNKMSVQHSSVMGNMLVVAQAIASVLDESMAENQFDISIVNDKEENTQQQTDISMDRSGSNSLRQSIVSSYPIDDSEPNLSPLEQLTLWDSFVDIQLRGILDHQVVGTYPVMEQVVQSPGMGIDGNSFNELGLQLNMHDDDDDDDDIDFLNSMSRQGRSHLGGIYYDNNLESNDFASFDMFGLQDQQGMDSHNNNDNPFHSSSNNIFDSFANFSDVDFNSTQNFSDNSVDKDDLFGRREADSNSF